VSFTLLALALGAGLFLGMLACIEVGRMLGLRQTQNLTENSHAGVGVVEGSVFGPVVVSK